MINLTYAFQPIVDVNLQQVFSYEALIRSTDNKTPKEIYSGISQKKLPHFDQCIREGAIKMAAQLGLKSNLNLNFISACLQFSREYLLDTINIFKENNLSINQLIVEILEEDIIHDHVSFSKLINEFRGQGVKVAIDDFGAGYSGLNLLASFQPDIIKLDMHLIRNIQEHGPRQAIIKAILQICISLGIDVIAEGVETVEEYYWLKKNGIYLFQGYLFAKPEIECLPSFKLPDLADTV